MNSPEADDKNRVENATASQRLGARSDAPQLGQYLLLDKLGQGGMGTVFKAFHNRLKRVVAVKLLRAERLDDSQAVARFYREMQAVGQLDHANIVRATDANEAEGHHFLVMDYVDGVNLAKLVDLCGPLGVAEACTLARAAATGLQYIHEQGLIHRDIKPSNLMLSFTGQVKILDLGLARFFEAAAVAEEVTPTGQVMGTADFMAPEQAHSSHDVDIRADVYSLGCTLFKLFTGKPPYAGGTKDGLVKKIMAHTETPIPDVRLVRPDVPPEISDLLKNMLAKKPADRPGPAEVARALEPWARADLASLAADAKSKLAEQVAGQGERPDGETGWFERSTYPKLPVAGTPTPRVEQAPPGHGRRPRMLISLALGLGLTGVAVILFRNQAETKTEKDVNPKSLLAAKAKDPAPGAEAYQELTAGRWHNVLQSPPHQLLWPKNAAIPPYFEPAREELMVSSNQLGLLGLGTTPHPGYVFKIFLRQHKWAGGLGIFFGFHPDTHQGKPCMRYQAIHFDFLNRKDPNQTFMFSRSLCMIYSDEYGDKVFPSHTKAGHAIARPTAREHNFEIEVSPQGLQKVLWGGQALSNLSTPEANKHFKAADYAGQFGIVCAASQGVFREARVLILEKENR